MGDLERATGVPRSTIRGYLQMGLLQAPRQVGPRTYLFDDGHLRALSEIRELRKQGVSLRDIKQRLTQASTPKAPAAAGPEVATSGRREHILAVATRMFAERGFDSVRLADIADETSMTKAALYRYFDSKDTLFVECVSEIRFLVVPREARANQGQHPNLDSRAAWRAEVALQNYETYQMVARFLMMVIFGDDAALSAKAKDAYHAMVTDVRDDMVQAAKQGLYRTDVDYDMHCYMLFGALMGAGLRRTVDPACTVDDALKAYRDLVTWGTLPGNKK